MADSPFGTCRSCGASVFWLKNGTTGRIAPIDQEPHADGNVLISLEKAGYEVVQDPLERATLKAHGDELRRNHFQTCPHQARWRDRQKREADRRKQR